MRLRLWLLLTLAAGCVDLSRPPELQRPPPGDAGAEPALPDAVPDAVPRDLATPAMADASVSLDLAAPVDEASAADAAVDASVSPDMMMPADVAAPSPDAAPLTPDLALPADAPPLPADAAAPPDLAPDLAPDAGPPPLVIDDFQSAGPINRNNLNSEVTWDHENCARVSGEMVCSYTGTGGFHDFIETLLNWCSYDGSKYRKFRFRLRTSVAGEKIDVFVTRNPTGGCNGTQVLLGTITSTTTMTTYELDLGPILASSKWLTAFEFTPKSTSGTQFIYDDLQLVP
jgi:hypothetical protein